MQKNINNYAVSIFFLMFLIVHSVLGMERDQSIGVVNLIKEDTGDDKQLGVPNRYDPCLQCKAELIRNYNTYTCTECRAKMYFCANDCYSKWIRENNNCAACNIGFFNVDDFVPYNQLKSQVKWDATIISFLCTLYAAKNIPTILGSMEHWRSAENCCLNVFALTIGVTTLWVPLALIEKKPVCIGDRRKPYEDKPFLPRLFSARSLFNMAAMSYMSAGFNKRFVITDIPLIWLKSLAISVGIEVLGDIIDPYIAKKFPQKNSYDAHGLVRFVSLAGVSQIPFDKLIMLLSKK